MAIVRRDASKASATGNNITTLAVTWAQTTLAGSLLVVMMQLRRAPSGAITVTPPGSYVSAGNIADQTTSNTYLFYQANAGAQTTTGNFTSSVTSTGWTMLAVEYTGVKTASPLDGSSTTNSGSSTSPIATALTTTTTDAVLACFGHDFANDTLSAPSTGFTIVIQAAEGATSCGFLEQVISAGTYTPGATWGNSGNWGVVTAGFQAAASANAGPGGHYMLGMGHHEPNGEPILSRRGRRNRRLAMQMLQAA